MESIGKYFFFLNYAVRCIVVEPPLFWVGPAPDIRGEVPPELSLFNKRIALSLTKNKQIPNPECNPPGPLIQAELAKLHSVLDTLDFRKMNLLPLRRLTLRRI